LPGAQTLYNTCERRDAGWTLRVQVSQTKLSHVDVVFFTG
jgi:hypothetical protein